MVAIRTPFSLEEFLKRLVKWIVHSDQPFTVIEEPEFREMLDLLKPYVIIPSARTIKREIEKVYAEKIVGVRDQLCKVGSKISITLDSTRRSSTCVAWPISQIWRCKHSCASWEQKPRMMTPVPAAMPESCWREAKVGLGLLVAILTISSHPSADLTQPSN
jgi:hypothetical protein